MMKFSGSEKLQESPAEVWAKLSDPRALGEALPDVEGVEVAGEGFEASFQPVTGLGATPMKVAFTVAEREEPKRLVVTGHGGAAEYAVRLRAGFELSAADGGTRVDWTLELRLNGILRSLTQRVIERLAQQQVAAVLASVSTPAAPVPG
jgi:carbon monoxide dehydrogenase subunit G